MGDILAGVEVEDQPVIRTVDAPLSTRPSIVIVRGSLLPGGGIVRLGGTGERTLKFRGPANIFHSRDEALAGIKAGRVKPGEVVVLRGLGVIGGPGMAMTSAVVFALDGAGLINQVAMITEGQLSGLVNDGLVVGEASPEAADGGPMAYVENGDVISIDVERKVVDLEVDDAVMAERRKTAHTYRRTGRARLAARLSAHRGARARRRRAQTLIDGCRGAASGPLVHRPGTLRSGRGDTRTITYGRRPLCRSDWSTIAFSGTNVLKEVSGDILLTGAQVIAHGVAPNDDFAQGLALQLRERYPSMAKDFRHYCQTAHPKAGEVWAWAGADGSRIVNLMTQDPAPSKGATPGQATAHNVNVALRHLKQLIAREGFTSVALPRLATGVGGLDWKTVQPLLAHHLGDLDMPIYVYTTYHAGQKGNE